MPSDQPSTTGTRGRATLGRKAEPDTCQEAAVNSDALTGDVRTRVAHKKRDQFRDVRHVKPPARLLYVNIGVMPGSALAIARR